MGRGALVLDGKREQIRSGEGKVAENRRRALSRRFECQRQQSPSTCRRGLWAFFSLCKGSDPNAKSTGHDYSKDVLNRTQVFAALLGS
jgi:hypothetical protein